MPELAVLIYKNLSASGCCLSTNAGNKGGSDERFADADRVDVAGNTLVANSRYYYRQW